MSSLEPVAYAGAWDQTERPEFFGCTPPYLPLAARRDVLVFQTLPLAAPLQVVGPIEADLFVATDGPDTDFTAKLIDVHPPSADYPKGYAMNLTDGILRLRYAEDPAQPRLRQPGEVVQVPHHAVSDREPVPAGPPHPAGHLVEQFPEVRCQPEHRRAGGHGAAQTGSGEHGVRRRQSAKPGGVAIARPLMR